MYRLIFLLFLSWLPHRLSAQQTVADVCAEKKRIADSTLHAIYGDPLYGYFVFDTSSRAITVERDWLHWDDTIRYDSIKFCRLTYLFEFPGAQPTPFTQAPIPEDTGVYLPPALRNVPKYSRIIDSSALDSICRKQIGRSSSECNIDFYNEHSVGTDRKPIPLNPAHIYFLVSYDVVTKKEKDGAVTTTTRSTIFVVDACTGEVPDKPEKVKTQWTSRER